ncbi:probable cationic amino acid transporter [Pollicipes pollicipes]|uniref:probable cationic amino acid transporter n=1 Tax=Pollicipes pollicipes TaxID=41117 RepID=UPI0018853AEF|nr:probable cationic amino acid transporter [Pollicipes pollicipes]
MNFVKPNTMDFKSRGLTLFAKLIRTKDPAALAEKKEDKGQLRKCLTTLDLTSLGVGSCVGTGMYLVSGMVAKNVAGPGVILSFTIAALASIFSGVCYAEFGVRVPNTSGGAYSYSYVTVGEFMAFVIGWNMVLEELIGTAACACALSACFDTLADRSISEALTNAFGRIDGSPPDFLAFALTVVMMLVLLAGVKKSVLFNNTLNTINFTVLVFVLGAGLFYADSRNWSDHGGFLPFGWSGVFTGAATCFYAFIGFDIIATTGEEAVNPKRSIPISIVLSLVIVLVAYVVSAAVLTLTVPYDQVDPNSGLVEMFGQVSAPRCQLVVAIGALAGLTVSMFGSMFSLPRIVYAMAKDGLIYQAFGEVWPVTNTPALATALFGVLAAMAALLIRLEVLVEMMSIGTLLAYTLVSTCVLILRYQPHTNNLIDLLPESVRTPIPGTPVGSPGQVKVNGGVPTVAVQEERRVITKKVTRFSPDSEDSPSARSADETPSIGPADPYMVQDVAASRYIATTPSQPVGQWDLLKAKLPWKSKWSDTGPASEATGRSVMKLVGLLYVSTIAFDVTLVAGTEAIVNGSHAVTWFAALCFLVVVLSLILISRKPQNRKALPFLAPCLPLVPGVAIVINIYLMFKLSIVTLIRFTVWMALGLLLYFGYGIHHSTAVLSEDSIELQVTTPPDGVKTERPAAANSLSPGANPFNPFHTATTTADKLNSNVPRDSYLTINGIDLK